MRKRRDGGKERREPEADVNRGAVTGKRKRRVLKEIMKHKKARFKTRP